MYVVHFTSFFYLLPCYDMITEFFYPFSIVFPADCREALLAVNRTSGVYMISPLNNDVEFQVFCDHDTHGGGWTVIQRRRSSSEKTNKTWAEYKTGLATFFLLVTDQGTKNYSRINIELPLNRFHHWSD